MPRILQEHAPPQRIRTYLVLFALGLAAPLLAIAVYALEKMASVEQAQIEQRVLGVARSVATAVDAELSHALATLETLAGADSLRAVDLRAFHARALIALKRPKAAIVLIDRSLQQLTDTLTPYGTPLPRTADPQTAQRVIDTRQPQISNLFRGSISGRPVFNVEVPVLDGEGEVRHVLIMSFQAAHIADVLKAEKPRGPWIMGVTDRAGIIMARSERHEDFVGKPLPRELLEQSRTQTGVYRATSVEGHAILRATVRSEHADWLISATVPVSHVEEPRRRGLTFAAVMLGAALALGALLALIFGRLMARPLGEATRVAAAVGQGEVVAVRRTALVEANLLMQTLADAAAELKRREEHAVFLMRELAHRAKNQLAVIKGMAYQTIRQSRSLEEFKGQFDRRLQGLALSQDVLVRENWQGAELRELARAQLELFAAGARTDLDGPRIYLGPNAVQNIGFALNELATNAWKHGAFAAPRGRVKLTWSESQDEIRLDWIETGVDGLTPPDRKGFGHRVVTELVPHALGGTATLTFTADGLHWQLRFPARSALGAQRQDTARDPA
jgi:two-component sensor histidine kinase